MARGKSETEGARVHLYGGRVREIGSAADFPSILHQTLVVGEKI